MQIWTFSGQVILPCTDRLDSTKILVKSKLWLLEHDKLWAKNIGLNFRYVSRLGHFILDDWPGPISRFVFIDADPSCDTCVCIRNSNSKIVPDFRGEISKSGCFLKTHFCVETSLVFWRFFRRKFREIENLIAPNNLLKLLGRSFLKCIIKFEDLICDTLLNH